MRKPISLILAFSIVLGFAIGVLARETAERWEFVDLDDGIRTWKLAIPGQDLPGFRGQTSIDATPEQIMEVMLDHSSHTKWMYRCAESRLLKEIEPNEAILYNRTSAPWPVWDRDVVVRSRVTRSGDAKQIEVTFQSIDWAAKKVPDRVVRMPKLVGFYKLRQLAPRKTEVTYQIESDIGGSIPGWLARRAAKELPYITLSRLRDRVSGKI